jgi:hypothetical protein
MAATTRRLAKPIKSDDDQISISRISARACLELMSGLTLGVGAEDFEKTATAVVRAKRELTDALK